MHSAYLLLQRGWLAGWLSVITAGIVSKTTKPILTLFRPSGSLNTKILRLLAPISNSKGNPFSGGVKYTGSGKN